MQLIYSTKLTRIVLKIKKRPEIIEVWLNRQKANNKCNVLISMNRFINLWISNANKSYSKITNKNHKPIIQKHSNTTITKFKTQN